MKFASVLLAAVFVFATGCTRGQTQGHPTTLTIAQIPEHISLNPLFDGDWYRAIGALVYSYLVTVDDHDQLVPDLAVVVPSRQNGGISKDGRTITYRLRSGVKWQDGQPLTSADIVFTVSAILNPKNNLFSRFPYEDVQSVWAPNPTTVIVRMKRVFSPIVSDFITPDSYPVLPAHLLAKFKTLNHVRFNEQPVGSGPYKVVSWVRSDHIDFEANPSYFRGMPKVQRIRLAYVPSPEVILEQLKTGEITAYFRAPASVVSNSWHTTPISGVELLVLNERHSVLKDKRLRRAIAAGIDFRTIVRNATHGGVHYDSAMKGMFHWAYDDRIPQAQFDPAKAKELLRQAGWRPGPDGVLRKNGEPLQLRLIYSHGEPILDTVAAQLQQALKGLGIDLSLKSYSTNVLTSPDNSSPLWSGYFDMLIHPAELGYFPDSQILFGCDRITPNGANVGGYCNKALDQEQAVINGSFDRGTQLKEFQKIQQQLALDVPRIFLWQLVGFYTIPRDLEGVSPSPLTPYWNAWQWYWRT